MPARVATSPIVNFDIVFLKKFACLKVDFNKYGQVNHLKSELRKCTI